MRRKFGPIFKKGDTVGIFTILTDGKVIDTHYVEYEYYVECNICNSKVPRSQRALELSLKNKSTNCIKCSGKKEFKAKTLEYAEQFLTEPESKTERLARLEKSKQHEELVGFDRDLLTLAMSLSWKQRNETNVTSSETEARSTD